METKNVKQHSLRYENGKIVLTGVVAVESFDEKELTIRLAENVLIIKGKNFVVEDMNIDSGVVTITGTAEGMTYHGKAEKLSLVKRLFK